VSNPFSALASHPECTHRHITAHNVAETGEPVPFWSCSSCGRRFAPTEPTDEKAYQLAEPREPADHPRQTQPDLRGPGALTATLGASAELGEPAPREHHTCDDEAGDED